jgi:hypothetical protein
MPIGAVVVSLLVDLVLLKEQEETQFDNYEQVALLNSYFALLLGEESEDEVLVLVHRPSRLRGSAEGYRSNNSVAAVPAVVEKLAFGSHKEVVPSLVVAVVGVEKEEEQGMQKDTSVAVVVGAVASSPSLAVVVVGRVVDSAFDELVAAWEEVCSP